MQTSMKCVFFCLIHFSVSQWLHSFKWFSYFKWRTWRTLWVILNIEISKSALLLANEHWSDQKKWYKWFSYEFSLWIRSRKNNSVNGMPENVASRRILTKMKALVYHRLWSNIKTFCRYKSPIYVYLPHEETDWKHPSFM